MIDEKNIVINYKPQELSSSSYSEMIQDKFLKHCKQHKRFIFCCQIICLLIFLSLWEISSQKGWIDIFFFSSPSRIVMLFIEMSQSGEMLSHISITLLETLLSFLIVNIVSIAVAIILLSSNTISEISEPYLVMLNALPKSALAPLIIVWLGTGLKTIIVAGASVAIFGSIINLYTGFHQVDTEKIKLIYTLGGTNGDTLNKVIIPASIPIIISNMKVNIGLSLVGVIIGEFLAARKGLGYLIIYSSQVFKLDLLIMSIIILCFIALFLYQLIHIMEKKYGTSRT